MSRKNVLKLAASRGLRHGLGVITAFIRPKLLAPEALGLFALISLLPTYSTYLHLGARSNLRYQVPRLKAQRQFEQADILKNSVFWGSFFLNASLAFFILVYTFVGTEDPITRFGLVAAALSVLLVWAFDHRLAELKSEEQFGPLARVTALRYSLQFVLTLTLLVTFGLAGLFLALPLSLLLMWQTVAKGSPTNRRHWSWMEFCRQVQQGFPILLLDLIKLSFRLLDKLLVSYFLGLEALGYYTLGTMLVGPLMNLPGAAREVSEPKLMRQAGLDTSSATLNRHYWQPMHRTAWLMPLLLLPVIILLPAVLQYGLPNYIPSQSTAQLLTLGCFFLALSYPARGLIVAHNWQVYAARAIWMWVPTVTVATALALQFWPRLETVAICFSLGYGLLAWALMRFLCQRFAIVTSQRRAAKLLIPFALLLIILAILSTLPANWPLWQLVGGQLLVAAIFAPLFWLQAKCSGDHS